MTCEEIHQGGAHWPQLHYIMIWFAHNLWTVMMFFNCTISTNEAVIPDSESIEWVLVNVA